MSPSASLAAREPGGVAVTYVTGPVVMPAAYPLLILISLGEGETGSFFRGYVRQVQHSFDNLVEQSHLFITSFLLFSPIGGEKDGRQIISPSFLPASLLRGEEGEVSGILCF